MDFPTGKAEKTLQDQMEKSIKKFKGNSGVGSDTANMAIKTEDVMITSQIETVLLAKGWKPPKANRKWSRSVSPQKPGAYKGKKNPLDKNYKVMKCFKYKCEHTEKC